MRMPTPRRSILRVNQLLPRTITSVLMKPQEFAKGTKMSFPGLQKPQDRADVVAYLESLK